MAKRNGVLDLIEEGLQRHHFDNIIILCPTLRWNRTYLDRSWIWRDDYVFLFEPRGNLFEIIEKLSLRFSGEETLFLIDDVIADGALDKTSEPVTGACNFGAS